MTGDESPPEDSDGDYKTQGSNYSVGKLFADWGVCEPGKELCLGLTGVEVRIVQ